MYVGDNKVCDSSFFYSLILVESQKPLINDHCETKTEAKRDIKIGCKRLYNICRSLKVLTSYDDERKY